jgi:hypothetical protein
VAALLMVLRPGCCDWRVEVAAVVGSAEGEAGLTLSVDSDRPPAHEKLQSSHSVTGTDRGPCIWFQKPS